jgi:excisionase family DNA binding protein
MPNLDQPLDNIRLLTLKEVADTFKVSVCTVKRWIKSNKLVGIRLPGNQWRVSITACNNLINRDKQCHY